MSNELEIKLSAYSYLFYLDSKEEFENNNKKMIGYDTSLKMRIKGHIHNYSTKIAFIKDDLKEKIKKIKKNAEKYKTKKNDENLSNITSDEIFIGNISEHSVRFNCKIYYSDHWDNIAHYTIQDYINEEYFLEDNEEDYDDCISMTLTSRFNYDQLMEFLCKFEQIVE